MRFPRHAACTQATCRAAARRLWDALASSTAAEAAFGTTPSSVHAQLPVLGACGPALTLKASITGWSLSIAKVLLDSSATTPSKEIAIQMQGATVPRCARTPDRQDIAPVQQNMVLQAAGASNSNFLKRSNRYSIPV